MYSYDREIAKWDDQGGKVVLLPLNGTTSRTTKRHQGMVFKMAPSVSVQ